MNNNYPAPSSRGLKLGKDELLAVLCCLIWGSCPPITKMSYAWYGIGSGDVTSMMLMAGIRFIISGCIIVAFRSIKDRRLFKPDKQDLKGIVVIGLILTALQYGIFFPGIANTLGVRTTVISGLTTFFLLIFAAIMYKEKLTWLKLLGCALGFTGVAYMSLSGTQAGGPVSFKGEGLVVLTMMTFSFGTLLSRRYTKKTDPALLTAYQLMFGGVVLTVLGALLGGRVQPKEPWQLCGILYLALASAICYTIWTSLFTRNPAHHISSFKFTEPIFGVICSALILAEADKVDWPKCVIALALVSAGILISNRPEKN